MPYLIKILEEEPCLRTWAADALGVMGDKASIPALIGTLKVEEDMHFTGTETILALGRLKAKEAVDIIITRGLRNEDPYVRQLR